jgi:hypothetical protein
MLFYTGISLLAGQWPIRCVAVLVAPFISHPLPWRKNSSLSPLSRLPPSLSMKSQWVWHYNAALVVSLLAYGFLSSLIEDFGFRFSKIKLGISSMVSRIGYGQILSIISLFFVVILLD